MLLMREREYCFGVKRREALARLPAALARLGAPDAPSRRRVLTDTYLDTDDLLLARAGAACRLRVSGKSAEATLKSLTPAKDGLAVRNELSEPLGESAAVWLRGTPGKGAIAARLRPLLRGKRLRVLFRLQQNRAVHRVRTADGSLIQVSADVVRWVGGNAGGEPAPFLTRHDIEVELMEGTEECLRRFAGKLRKKMGLRAAKESKYQYGLRLAGLTRPAPPERRQPALQAQSLEAILRAVMAGQTERLLWHKAGAILGLDSEPIHDLRVAIRRLRAALRVFAGALPPELERRLGSGLKRLAASLGVVRDLDVHVERVARDAGLLGLADNPAVIAYLRRLNRRRDEAHRRLARELNSKRTAAVAENLEEAARRLLPSGRLRESTAGTGARAAALIEPFFRKFRRDGGRVHPNSRDESLHRLRLRCKRLRYACEFLKPALGDNAGKYAARLARLQGILGRLHDAAMAAETIRRFLATPAARRRPGAGIALLRLAAQAERQARAERREFFAAWKRFDRKRVHSLLLGHAQR